MRADKTVLARRHLPREYVEFNKRFWAPFGRSFPMMDFIKSISWSLFVKLSGPFSVQPNNTLREFEYPWAYSQFRPREGTSVLEIGGGLSGFQFVLARAGMKVVNVDPGMAAKGVGWTCNEANIRQLNKIFGTRVELQNTTAAEAELADESFDCAYSISVIEHLPEDEIIDVMKHVYRCLKPGGLFILTVDLFLNLFPFTDRMSNEYGKNVDVKWLVGLSPFVLERGEKSELFGYPEFSPGAILRKLEDFYLGQYPALSQCLVLRKKA